MFSWSVVAERSSALDSSSGVVRMWVWIPVAALVSLSRTLNHNCFVFRMGRKAVGPVRCAMHVKESRTLIEKEKGACPDVSGLAANAPSTLSMFRVYNYVSCNAHLNILHMEFAQYKCNILLLLLWNRSHLSELIHRYKPGHHNNNNNMWTYIAHVSTN